MVQRYATSRENGKVMILRQLAKSNFPPSLGLPGRVARLAPLQRELLHLLEHVDAPRFELGCL